MSPYLFQRDAAAQHGNTHEVAITIGSSTMTATSIRPSVFAAGGVPDGEPVVRMDR